MYFTHIDQALIINSSQLVIWSYAFESVSVGGWVYSFPIFAFPEKLIVFP